MELKTYQRQVIADLNRYLETAGRNQGLYRLLPPLFGRRRVHPCWVIYQDVLPGVPQPLLQGAHRRRENLSCLQRCPAHV